MAWQTFLDGITNSLSGANKKPGEVMIAFLNKHLEPLDGIEYKISCDGLESKGKTTVASYCVKIKPVTLKPIQVQVWSRRTKAYKTLDPVTPLLGEKKLVRKIMQSFKIEAKTVEHKPEPKPVEKPKKPAPAPAPAPSPKGNQGVEQRTATSETGQPQEQVRRSVPDKITKEQLKKIFTGGKDDYLQKVADELNTDLAKYKLDTVFRKAHFFGQIRQEAGIGMSATKESFDYSPIGLIATFSAYYGTRSTEAQADGRIKAIKATKTKPAAAGQAAKQEVIANKAYGLKGVGDTLGNTEVGDGWKFKGRGLKQLTGRSNYTAFQKEYANYWNTTADIVSNPDLVLTLPNSVRSAVYFWVANNCWKKADLDTVEITDVTVDAVTKIVNRGEINKHIKGKYKKDEDPVVHRRTYVKSAYDAFI